MAIGDNYMASNPLIDNRAGIEEHDPERPPTPADNPDSLDLTSLQGPLDAVSSEPHDHDHDRDHDQEGAEYILELQEHLDSLPSDDPARSMQLFLLGCAIADHHVKGENLGLGDMPKVISFLEEAIAATPDDDNVRRSYCNALQNMY